MVESATLGLVKVPLTKVVAIRPVGTAPAKPGRRAVGGSAPAPLPATGGAGSPQALAAMQARLAADPQVMAEILRLADDPEVVKLVTDPEVLAILAAGDLRAAEKSEKIRKLAAHPRLRALLEKLAAQARSGSGVR